MQFLTLTNLVKLASFLDTIGSSRNIDYSVIIKSLDKLPMLDKASASHIIHQMLGEDISIDEFFDLAEDQLNEDTLYNRIKQTVQSTDDFTIDNAVTTDSGVGLAINKVMY